MIYPRATKEQEEGGGWILEYYFLQKVREAVENSWELEHTTLEDIETILIQAEHIIELAEKEEKDGV